MKLLIEKNVLIEGLNAVSRALSTRNIIPVLNCIKFDLKENGLYLTATDNDITIQYYIDKEYIKNIEETGCSIIYGKTLLEIIRKINNNDILIENFENNEVSFKTQNSTYNFNCYMVEDYPNISLEEVKNPIKISSNVFKEIINKTTFACSLQESNPVLTGVNIKIQGNSFECVATDSYRISKINLNLNEIYMDNINIVIPAKNINEFVKILNNDTDLEIHVFSNKVIFKLDNIIFQSSLLNGNYPQLENIFPKEYEYQVKVNLKELYNTLDRASLFTGSNKKYIVDVEIKDNNLIMKASNTEMGKVEEKIEINNITNNNIYISFSSKYMLEALKMFDKEEIYILLNSGIKPFVLKEENNDNFIQLIFPIQTI